MLVATVAGAVADFIETIHFHRYVQLKEFSRRKLDLVLDAFFGAWICSILILYCRQKILRVFRVLGRGAFGAVSAVQKSDTQAIYAMKEMDKKQVKHSKSEWMVINEKVHIVLSFFFVGTSSLSRKG